MQSFGGSQAHLPVSQTRAKLVDRAGRLTASGPFLITQGGLTF